MQILAVGFAFPGSSEVQEEPNQKSSCINDEAGEAFELMTDLRYSAFNIRAAEVLGPTVTPDTGFNGVQPHRARSTRGFGSVMQHTTLFHASFNQGFSGTRSPFCHLLGGNMVPD